MKKKGSPWKREEAFELNVTTHSESNKQTSKQTAKEVDTSGLKGP